MSGILRGGSEKGEIYLNLNFGLLSKGLSHFDLHLDNYSKLKLTNAFCFVKKTTKYMYTHDLNRETNPIMAAKTQLGMSLDREILLLHSN